MITDTAGPVVLFASHSIVLLHHYLDKLVHTCAIHRLILHNQHLSSHPTRWFEPTKRFRTYPPKSINAWRRCALRQPRDLLGKKGEKGGPSYVPPARRYIKRASQ